jgi:hypothetical protein
MVFTVRLTYAYLGSPSGADRGLELQPRRRLYLTL